MSARVPETSRIPFPLSPWVMWKALSFITTSASTFVCPDPIEFCRAPALAARAKTAIVIALPTMYLMAHSYWLKVGLFFLSLLDHINDLARFAVSSNMGTIFHHPMWSGGRSRSDRHPTHCTASVRPARSPLDPSPH